jgi:hypothetical protein
MKVIRKDVTIPWDVDKTLIFWQPTGAERHESDIQMNYYGEIISVTPHLEMLQLLRSNLARGRNIIIWSGNGFAWAEEVVKKLHEAGHLPDTKGIIIMTKPAGYADDLDCQHWMGNRIYIEPHSNPYAEEKK